MPCCFDRSDTFQLIDISRAKTRGEKGGRDGIYVRIEGNKRSSLFRALDIFLYDRSCVFCERTLARSLGAAFRREDAENEDGGSEEKNPPRGGGIRNRMWLSGHLGAGPHEPNRERVRRKRNALI